MFVLTVDYEVFGDGSGCLEACVIRPVDRMLAIADKFSAPITFFVEGLEFEVMQQAETVGIELVLHQLKELFYSGHDIQLHIHPQWNGAKWNGNYWYLNRNQWRLGDLDADLIFLLIQRGKKWLESLLNSNIKNYNCIAFRAGGWCIQPSHDVISALIRLGFQIDSTVVPGLQNLSMGDWFNFRKVPNKPFWMTKVDICNEDSTGLWELPILTGRIGRLKHFQSLNLARSFGSSGLAAGCKGNYHGANGIFQTISGKFGKLMHLGNVMLDISTMPVDVLIEITKQWLSRFGDCNKPIPIVAIAHTKNFTEASERNMLEFFTWLNNEQITFSTYGQWLESLKESGKK